MGQTLERDLGLFAITTLSIGAMIGSGIFVLPGAAAAIAGPGVIIAYAIAGLLVLPVALSKAEMATAMPESGGTYLFIQRAMGPMMGTMAGIGVWLTVLFKAAFALMGIGIYLQVFDAATIDPKTLALGLTALLMAINILGVKKTGSAQVVIVGIAMTAILFFIAAGARDINPATYDPFLPKGWAGVFTATGVVFVSYAGVTKIASVAEEIKDPGRNLPLGMLVSLGLMIVVYSAIVAVIVGVWPEGTLSKEVGPIIADTAGLFLGDPGRWAFGAIAVLALTSMANAGLLICSRYPLAMARDQLAPKILAQIHDRFRTPVWSILLTGGAMMGIIAFVPVLELAKLGSAFAILVFALVQLAHVSFRRSGGEDYQPAFKAPLFPWLQIVGIVGGLLLLTQMNLLPLLGALGFVAMGFIHYFLYGRKRTTDEGVAQRGLRERVVKDMVAKTETALDQRGEGYRVLIALDPNTHPKREAALFRIAKSLVHRQGGSVHVVRFEDVPDQMGLGHAARLNRESDIQFEERMAELSADADFPVLAHEVVAHNTKASIVKYARQHSVNMILAEWGARRRGPDVFGGQMEWLVDKAPCDVVLMKERDLGEIDEVLVTLQKAPSDPFKVAIADAIATETDGEVHLLSVVPPNAAEGFRGSLEAYHREMDRITEARTRSEIVVQENAVRTILEKGRHASVMLVGARKRRWIPDFVYRDLAEDLIDDSTNTVLVVHAQETRSGGMLRALRDRVIR